jgi:diguanylate cyclase (GGDEF)-like protein
LTIFFFAVVFVPLAAGSVIVLRLISDEIRARRVIALGPVLDLGAVAFNERTNSLDEALGATIKPRPLAPILADRDEARLQYYLRRGLDGGGNQDFMAVVDSRDEVVAYVDRRTPQLAAGVRGIDPFDIVAGEAVGTGYVKVELPLEIQGDGTEFRLVGGFWLDQEFLAGFTSQEANLSLVDGRRVVASTANLGNTRAFDVSFNRHFNIDLAETVSAEARRISGDLALVATSSESAPGGVGNNVIISMVGIGLLALMATAFLARVLANLVMEPVRALANRTQLVAEGRYEPIPVTEKGEVGQLALGFNNMAMQLDQKLNELETSRAELERSHDALRSSRDALEKSHNELQASRDQLRRAIRRVGDTLRSTHNMSQIRESILDTAADAVGADAAIIWNFNHTREELIPVSTRGLDSRNLDRVSVGKGVAGLVAERLGTIVLPAPSGGPTPVRGEPNHPYVIATPLLTEDIATAVLTMYRLDGEFDEGDAETVRFLAEQGGVAMENVILHEDARKLSLTDGLTGVWNVRYLKMQFPQILATASRFGRNFSVLMLDLDNFKIVNDTYGHQRGDAILIEFSKRVGETLREVDHFIRYGGEEFLCLLTETSLSGAKAAADKILLAVRSDSFGTSGEELVDLTVSVGVASYPEHGASYERLISAADGALYRAKHDGRDRWRVADGTSPGLRLA